jgi:hypothetical protein
VIGLSVRDDCALDVIVFLHPLIRNSSQKGRFSACSRLAMTTLPLLRLEVNRAKRAPGKTKVRVDSSGGLRTQDVRPFLPQAAKAT